MRSIGLGFVERSSSWSNRRLLLSSLSTRNMWHFNRITSGPLKGAWMHSCFLKESRKLCTYMSRQAASEGDPFDADPIPFLPALPAPQKEEKVVENSRRGRAKSTGDSLEQIPPTISFTNPPHSMTWHQAECDYQSSSISGPESRLMSQQQQIMMGLDDFVHPNFLSTTPLSMLEPTPILESKIPLRRNGSHRMVLETERNLVVPTTHISSSFGGRLDLAFSADPSVLDEPSIPLSFTR